MKITILLHGPFSDNAYEKLLSSLKKIPKHYRSELNIIAVCYTTDFEETKVVFEKFSYFSVQFIQSKDLINPGFFNMNRQILTVSKGLSAIDGDAFVIKLRNDMWISWKKLFKILKKNNFLQDSPEKIFTTNCFTRKDRLYHPSDLFLCGWKKTLCEYYSRPLTDLTQINWQLSILKKTQESDEPFYKIMFSPESELFSHYLKVRKWDFKNTLEDSYEAIKKYCLVINTWDIDLRWNKKRNAFLPKGTIILPYKFSLEPFAGVPKENAECYARHDFEGHKTLRDIRYLALARFVFGWKYTYKNAIRTKVIKILKKIYRSPFFPELGRRLYWKFFRR